MKTALTGRLSGRPHSFRLASDHVTTPDDALPGSRRFRHRPPKTKLGRRLREQHMRHHFQDHRYGYGVSSPLWDVVFRTLPNKRRY